MINSIDEIDTRQMAQCNAMQSFLKLFCTRFNRLSLCPRSKADICYQEAQAPSPIRQDRDGSNMDSFKAALTI
jgi:hypothetical protein